ncbi:MAG: cyanophycin synthetase, partial [Acidobacteriota bacterium]
EEEALGKVYDSRLIGRLWRYIAPYRWQVALTIGMVAPMFALELAPAWIVKSGLDRLLTPEAVEPGRLERIDGPVDAFVDYAHTPAALEAALRSLRELTPRPIVAVFGCGGERDRGKRPEMGRAAGALADVSVLTSDNPRREDPARILADAEVGLREVGATDYVLEIDRRRAIEAALERASALGGVALVAGRGHETAQDLGHETIEFDDRDEVRRAMAQMGLGLRGQRAPGRGPADPGRVDAAAGLGVSRG